MCIRDRAEGLVRQMQEMGIADAHVDADGYVYGTIPANCEKALPVYGLIAHMDTAPDAPGENIRARVTGPYTCLLYTSNPTRVLYIVSVLLAIVYVLAGLGVMVFSTVLMIKRFHQNFLTDEGYLMFTLPVSVHSLLLSLIHI